MLGTFRSSGTRCGDGLDLHHLLSRQYFDRLLGSFIDADRYPHHLDIRRHAQHLGRMAHWSLARRVGGKDNAEAAESALKSADRILFTLKTRGPLGAQQFGNELAMTSMGPVNIWNNGKNKGLSTV